MTDWVPSLASLPGPRYLAFVAALEADIGAGWVKPGMRLLPQRDMAQRLDLSVGTVSKAYAEAEQRGLISGEVGRGTFVTDGRPAVPSKGSRRPPSPAAPTPPSPVSDSTRALRRVREGYCDGRGRARRCRPTGNGRFVSTSRQRDRSPVRLHPRRMDPHPPVRQRQWTHGARVGELDRLALWASALRPDQAATRHVGIRQVSGRILRFMLRWRPRIVEQ